MSLDLRGRPSRSRFDDWLRRCRCVGVCVPVLALASGMADEVPVFVANAPCRMAGESSMTVTIDMRGRPGVAVVSWGDEASSSMGVVRSLSAGFFCLGLTLMGRATAERATIELIGIGSARSMRAATAWALFICEVVMAGTAGVLGAEDVVGDGLEERRIGVLAPDLTLTMAALARSACWAGMGLTMALLR